MINEKQLIKIISELNQKDPKAIRQIERNIRVLATRWHETDGSADAFYQFCLKHYVPSEKKQALFCKIESKIEKMIGLSLQINWSNIWSITMQDGPVEPVDEIIAKIDPQAHFLADIYASQLAFVILLNFPLLSLEEKEKLSQSAEDRFQLAQSRLAEMCQFRIPFAVSQQSSLAANATFQYLDHMLFDIDRVHNKENECLFETPKKLDCHWGIRDEINLCYQSSDRLCQQLILAKIWERIIAEEVPGEYLSSKKYSWEPISNELVDNKTKEQHSPTNFHIGRYTGLKKWFEAKKQEDAFSPEEPNFMQRSFNLQREFSETGTEQLFIEFLTNPLLPRCAEYLKKNLKRELHAFDIVFNQFELFDEIQRGKYDDILAQQFPRLSDFQAQIPSILIKLGFSKTLSAAIAKKINVVACRTGGFAVFPKMRGGEYLLTVATQNGKMDFMAFSTAMHELGHCVEGYLSSEQIDYYMLGEVPNHAFTEAFAFLFDSKSFEILGINHKNKAIPSSRILNLFWTAYLDCGIALVDMECWRWMYANPQASTEQLKTAVIRIARNIWNQYFWPILGEKDSTILAGYSPMLMNPIYMPDYAIAIFIQTQLEVYLQDKVLGQEMPRLCGLGKLTPNAWMNHAVGESVSSRELLNLAESVLLE